MHKDPKEYFVDKIEEDIREIEEQMDELKTRLEDSGWEPSMDYETQIENVRLRLKELKKEIDRFEVSGGSTWNAFKRNCEDTLSAISRDAQEVAARMDKILLE